MKKSTKSNTFILFPFSLNTCSVKILINNRLVIKSMPCKHCIKEEWNEGIDGKWVKMCDGKKCSAFDYTYCECDCHTKG